MNQKEAITNRVNVLVKDKRPELTVTLREIQKNNGTVETGLAVSSYGCNITGIIYPDFDLDPGQTVDGKAAELAAEVLSVPGAELYANLEDAESFLKAGKPIVTLINTELNGALLGGTPHKEWEDLSVIIRLVEPDIGASTIVTYGVLKVLGTTFDELYAEAEANTREMLSIVSIAEMLNYPADPEQPEMLTIFGGTIGCYMDGGLLFPEILQKAAERLEKERIIILPSSVHELIAVGIDSDEDVAGFKDIVGSVNCTAVEQRDFLSNNVYIYTASTGKVAMA